MNLPRVAAALADPVRIAMLGLIADPPAETTCASGDEGDCSLGICVCEFVRHLRISQPRASYHLRILREAGLVIEQPRGKWTYYSTPPGKIDAFCRELKAAAGTMRSGRAHE